MILEQFLHAFQSKSFCIVLAELFNRGNGENVENVNLPYDIIIILQK